MKGKDSNENRSYAFVTFRTKQLASNAIQELNNAELREESLSIPLLKQKISSSYPDWGEADTKKVVTKVGLGVVALELLTMSNPKFKLDDNAPPVSWAYLKVPRLLLLRPCCGMLPCKPQSDQKLSGESSSQKAAILPSYPPHIAGSGLVGSPYGAIGTAYSVSNPIQLLIYGRELHRATLLMPMLLPDGIGNVLNLYRSIISFLSILFCDVNINFYRS